MLEEIKVDKKVLERVINKSEPAVVKHRIRVFETKLFRNGIQHLQALADNLRACPVSSYNRDLILLVFRHLQ